MKELLRRKITMVILLSTFLILYAWSNMNNPSDDGARIFLLLGIVVSWYYYIRIMNDLK